MSKLKIDAPRAWGFEEENGLLANTARMTRESLLCSFVGVRVGTATVRAVRIVRNTDFQRMLKALRAQEEK